MLDYHPFDDVTLHRVRDVAGEPTHWYSITGSRHGVERSCRVHYEELFRHADQHLRQQYGKTSETATSAEWGHAILRAAVAFLMD